MGLKVYENDFPVSCKACGRRDGFSFVVDDDVVIFSCGCGASAGEYDLLTWEFAHNTTMGLCWLESREAK